jgi:hypothetical protein
MGNWFRFFLGTPKRFIWTVVAIGAIAVWVNPAYFSQNINLALGLLFLAVEPYIGGLVVMVILFAAAKNLLGGNSKKK